MLNNSAVFFSLFQDHYVHLSDCTDAPTPSAKVPTICEAGVCFFLRKWGISGCTCTRPANRRRAGTVTRSGLNRCKNEMYQ